MTLQEAWDKYRSQTTLNYEDIAPYIGHQGQVLRFDSGQTMVERGDFPAYVYFMLDGIAIGQRHYEDGNEYRYFQVDQKNGNLGLLEILGRKERYVATITCLTDVKVVKVPSALVYEVIMTHLELIRKSTFLLADDLYQRSGNDGIYYFYSGIDRVRLFIITYYDQHWHPRTKTALVVQMSYEEIANQVGLSVRTVGRSIKKLKESDEVLVKGKQLVVSREHYAKMKQRLIK